MKLRAKFVFRPLFVQAIRLAFVATSIAYIFALGSTDPVQVHALNVILFAITLSSTIVGQPKGPLLPVLVGVAIILMVTVIFAFLRPYLPALAGASPYVGGDFTSPGSAFAGVVGLSAPIAVFVTSLALFSTDKLALRLLSSIAAVSAVILIASLVQFVLSPDTLFFAERHYYAGSFTLTLVNRNSAATLLGLIGLICLANLLKEVRGLSSSRLLSHSRQIRGAQLWLALWWTVSLAACLAGLMLTRSRGGIAASLAGGAVFLFFWVVAMPTRLQSEKPSARRTLRRFVVAFFALAGVALVGLLLSGRAQLRAITLEDDPRFCVLPGLIRLLNDNWLLGTGLGTFREVFPAYRDAICGMSGVWDMAHNFYIEGWITLGILFPLTIGAALSLLIAIVIVGLHTRFQQRWVPILGLSAFTTVALHAVVDFSLQIPGIAAMFAIILGVTFTVSVGKYDIAQAGRRNSRRDANASP